MASMSSSFCPLLLSFSRTRLRTAAVVTAAALTASVLVATGSPAAQAKTGAAQEKPAAETYERPDAVSARLAAQATRHEILVADATTETSRTFVRPDGSLRSELSLAPVRVQRSDGAWHDVDYNLARVDGGYAPKASPVPVTFSAGGSGPAVRLGTGAREVQLSWTADLPAPTIKGNSATYALTKTQSLVLSATVDGFEQSLVLSAPPTTTPKMKLLFDSELAMTKNKHGGFDFRTKAGKARWRVPPPVAYSSAFSADREVRTQVHPLTSTLETAADGSSELNLSTAMSFLQDPDTVYPVTIDPVVASVSRVGDTYLVQGDSSPKVNTYDLYVGPSTSGVLRRALLRFGAGSLLGGTHVTNATLNLYQTNAETCTAKPIYAYPVTADYDMGLAVWSNQPAVSTSSSTSGTASFSHGFTGCAKAADSINITSMAQYWADNPSLDYGLQLRADEVDLAAGKRFCSMDLDATMQSASCITATNFPTLSVTYNTYPGIPTSATWSPRILGTDSAKMSTSLTPTFSGAATNADGNPYKLQVEVSHNPSYPAEGTGVIWTGTSENTTPGATASVTAPSGLFTAGWHVTYRMRAGVTNGAGGTDYSGWTSSTNFFFNINGPAAPSISCTTYPANAYSTYSASGSTCTLDTTSTDGSGYVWSLDDPNPTTEVVDATNSGAAKTITIVPAKGWHTLYAYAKDTARHASPTITSYSFGVGQSAVTSPAAWDSTAKAVALASSTSSTYVNVTYQWAPGATGGTFSNIPVGHVTPNGSSTPISAWPLTGTTSGSLTKFSGHNWDVAATMAGASKPNGAVRIRALFKTAGGTTLTSDAVTFTLNQGVFSVNAPTADVGPGTVSLLSGDMGVNSTDASVNGLGISRTHTSLSPPATSSGARGIFGPGWAAGLESVGHAGSILVDNSTNGSMLLREEDGTEYTYVQQPNGTYLGADDANDGSVLTYSTTITNPANSGDTTTYTGWQLKDADGTITTWVLTSGTWLSKWVDAVGTQGESTIARDINGRVTVLVAPSPTGLTCTTSNYGTTPGCQGLSLSYATATTATGTVEASWGNYIGYVSGISWTGYDPATSAMVTKQVAAYLYDNTGRLRAAWDPRLTTPLKTRYTYNGNGRLASVTKPGRSAQNLNYDTTGRLASVSWTDPANGTATQAVVYGLGLSGVSGAPDVSGATAATWGQSTDVAYVGGAVFPPSRVPTVNGTTGAYVPSSVDWPYASISYADVNGLTVNEAAYGAGAWQISTSRYDASGNKIWSLTPGNRAQALTPTSSTDPYVASQGSSITRANLLATTTSYSADGVRPVSALGPAHPIRLSSGVVASARIETRYVYDEGAPTTDSYGLLTTTSITPLSLDGTDVPAADVRVTRTGYNPIDGSSATGPSSGWTLRAPTTRTVQMSASPSSADLVTQTRYNSAGQVVEQRLPGASASDANTTVTTYFSSAVNATYPSCGGKPYWAGLVCRSDPGGAASAGHDLPSKVYTYDLYQNVLTVVESVGTVTRTATFGYDPSGRATSKATAVAGLASSTPLPAVSANYNGTTGDVTSITAGSASVSATYDALGRALTQVDARSNTTTFTYDIDGNVKTLNDGKGIYTYGYDTSTEHRGLATSVNAGMGTLSLFTGTYDADGRQISQTYPNGLVSNTSFDNAGSPFSLTYTLPTYAGGPAATRLTFSQLTDAFGNVVHVQSPASAQDHAYDAAGRLSTVQDTYAGLCITRNYAFSAQSDRLSSSVYGAAGGGACQSGTASSTKTSTYDNANRITSSGYTYDQLGRTLTAPASDLSAGNSALSTTYFDNDRPRSMTQGAAVKTFSLDPLHRYDEVVDTVNGTETLRIRNHYADGSDMPSWIESSTNGGGTWSWVRSVLGLSGSLAAVQTAAGTPSLQITNLHGDVVATVPNQVPSSADPSGASVNAYFESTEYGTARSGSYSQRYTWLGAALRSSEALGAVILMGARLYNPASGRFLSVDPVPGGTANAYVYPTDPIGDADPTGMYTWSAKWYDWLRYSGSKKYHFRHITAEIRATKAETKNLSDLATVWGFVTSTVTWALEKLSLKFAKPILGRSGVAAGVAGVVALAVWAYAKLAKSLGRCVAYRFDQTFWETRYGWTPLYAPVANPWMWRC